MSLRLIRRPLRPIVVLALAAGGAAAASCAAGSSGNGTTTSASASSSSGWTGLGGAGGMGGATSSAGSGGSGAMGGMGGMTTSSTSSTSTSSTSTSTTSSTSTTGSTSSSSASSTTSSSGAPTCTSSAQCTGGLVCVTGHCGSAVILLAGSPTALLAGTYQPGGAWATTMLADGTSFGTSLTLDGSGRGVGVYTSATGSLVSSTIWSNGAWGTAAPINASAAAREQPFLDSGGGATSHLVYQDMAYHYWYLAFTGTWTASPEAVGPAGSQSYGPVPAAIAARGADATAAIIDGQSPSVNYAAQLDRTGGAWQARNDLAGPESFSIPPAIVPLSTGPELMMVFVQQDAKIHYLTRTGGAWSAPAFITGCLTNDRVALAPLPGGGAILAFRGQDTNLYWSMYSGGAWSTVAPLVQPNVSISRPPAVSRGAGGAVAEIAFVQTADGKAYHGRLIGGVWAYVEVGGANVNGVAIAATP